MAENGLRIRSTSISKPVELPGAQAIEYAVTHEVNINGDKMWVKYGLTADLSLTTTDEVVSFVNTKVLEAAQRAAESVSNL